jgi:diaminopimelate epimerase
VTFPSSKSELKIDNIVFKYVNVNVGNPHCVIFNQKLDKKNILKYGKVIEHHPLFPNKTNVQYVEVIDRSHIKILIWERGAGYTLSSGSSSIACAAAAYHLGLCDQDITVSMLGGELFISFDESFNALMKGKARKVFEGII